MLNRSEENALISLFSYFKNSDATNCYLDRKTYLKYSNSGDKFSVKNPYDIRRNIFCSKDLFKDVATEGPLKERILDFFNQDEKHQFEFMHIIAGDKVSIKLDKSTFVKGLEAILKTEPKDSEDYEKFSNLFSTLSPMISEDALVRAYLEPNAFACNIDNVDKYFNPYNFIEVLRMPEDEYKEFISNLDMSIGTASKTEFMYALTQFAKQEHIFERFALPDATIERFAKLQANQEVDLESINKFSSTDDNFQGQFTVSPKLEKEILKDMPEGYSSTEQAIYIYIKMCKTLTYDQEFYAVNQSGIVAKRHEDLDHIKDITPTKNNVVCYEFNAIYSHFLTKLGINYNIESKSDFLDDGTQAYGGAHAFLNFRDGKFLVKADSVESIFNGDLSNLKQCSKVTGLKCLNKNEQTVNEFNGLVSGVVEDILQQEIAESTTSTIDSYEYQQALNMYLGLSNSSLPPIDKRVSTIIEQLNACKLPPMDTYSYLLQLRQIQFSTDEKNYCFRASILRENPENPLAPIGTRCIISTSECFIIPENPITYYSFRPGEEVVKTTQEEVLSDLREGRLEYINSKTEIPGIVHEGGTYDIATNQDQWELN